MRRDSNDYRGGFNHDERRGLLVLSIWTMLLVAMICGSGLLAYKIYYETASRADASVETGKLSSSPRQRRRTSSPNSERPARNDARTPASNPDAPSGEYQVYSASEQPALPSPQEQNDDREVASARRPAVAEPPAEPAHPDAPAKHALPFSLQLNGPRVPVGPLTLRLESSAPDASTYSVNACRGDDCVLLSNLQKDQVRVFSLPNQQRQFEVIITRSGDNHLTGLLTVLGD